MSQKIIKNKYFKTIALVFGVIILLSIASLSHIWITAFIGSYSVPYIVYNDTDKPVVFITFKPNATELEEKSSRYVLQPSESGSVSPNVKCIFVEKMASSTPDLEGYRTAKQPYEKVPQDKKTFGFIPAPKLKKYLFSNFEKNISDCTLKELNIE